MDVHFNQKYISTFLSFKEVSDIPGVKTTMDTNQERAMTITLQNRTFFIFNECTSWLFYYDTENKYEEAERNNNINNNTIIDCSCLQTVKENKNFLTTEEIYRTSKTRIYQSILCWPSITIYINIVEKIWSLTMT